MLNLQGRNAIAERQRRLLILTKPMKGHQKSPGKVPKQPSHPLNEVQMLQQGIADYQRFWQERFKGQTTKQLASSQAYRLGSDRWILQRLARRGYSRQQARSILIRSSPELMNQRPHERLAYLRRMVNQVYIPYEQQQRLATLKENGKRTISETNPKIRDMPKLHQTKPSTEKTILKEQQPQRKSGKAIDRSPEHGLER